MAAGRTEVDRRVITHSAVVRRVAALGIALLVLLGGPGCMWGTRPHELRTATGPRGAHVTLQVRDEKTRRTGELYAVDSIGIMVRDTRLTRIVWARVLSLDVVRLDATYDLRYPTEVSPAYRARLALVSRFPQGLEGPLLQAVLDRLGQETLDELR